MQNVLSKFNKNKFILIQTIGEEFPNFNSIKNDIEEIKKKFKDNIIGIYFNYI